MQKKKGTDLFNLWLSTNQTAKIAEPGVSPDPKGRRFLGLANLVFTVPLAYSPFPWGK